MGNPQVTPTELAWLAGIWDGEGTFSVNKISTGHWAPRITLGNTSKMMIDEIMRIAALCGVTPSISLKKTYSVRHAQAWHLTINKQSDIKVMALAMLPYLVNKRWHAAALTALVDSRTVSAKTRRGIWSPETKRLVGSVTGGYTQWEVDLSNFVLSLNRKGNQKGTPETERRILAWQGKIQSDLERELQKAKETIASLG